MALKYPAFCPVLLFLEEEETEPSFGGVEEEEETEQGLRQEEQAGQAEKFQGEEGPSCSAKR